MKAECVATKDEIIHILSASSDRYGNLLIALMDRWGASSLQEITDEQAQQYLKERPAQRRTLNYE